MFSLIMTLVDALDTGACTSAVFLDLTKAFDLVDHNLLLEKMAIIGVRGVALDWFRSYLTGRKLMVDISYFDNFGTENSQLSDSAIVECGVPQGSVLGPILFLIYINDLPSSISGSGVGLFVDDISISFSNCNRNALEIQTFLGVCNVLSWLEDNRLIANVKKTQMMEFAIRNKSNVSQMCFLLEDQEVRSVSQVRFLGLMIDDKLTFSGHIDLVCKKISTGIFVLRQLSLVVNIDVLLPAYYGLVYPFLSYAVAIWGTESSRTLVLFRLQKRALRTIFGVGRCQSCRPLFIANSVLTYPSIYIFQVLTFLKRNEPDFNSYFPAHNYNLRETNNLPIPSHSTTFFKKHLKYSAISLFNCLPNWLQVKSANEFSRHLKNFLIAGAYYSVGEFKEVVGNYRIVN